MNHQDTHRDVLTAILHFYKKGVIEILSSVSQTWSSENCMKVRLAIAPALVAYTRSARDVYLRISVWGYCFIHAVR